MIDDEIVKKHSLTPPGYGGDARTGAVIFKLAGQLKPDVCSRPLLSYPPKLIKFLGSNAILGKQQPFGYAFDVP
jgi:hypothetical protein